MSDVVDTNSIQKFISDVINYLIGTIIYIISLLPNLFGKVEGLARELAEGIGHPELTEGFEILIIGLSFLGMFLLLQKFTRGFRLTSTIVGVVIILALLGFFLTGQK